MKTLLVANTGGHLAQIHRLSRRLGSDDFTWVTFDTEQSRTLLAGEKDVLFAPFASSRDIIGALKDFVFAQKLLSRRRFDRAISTGASIAVSFLPLCRAHGISTHYIESATRANGPSLSGRIVSHVPGIHLYTQHESWADGKWNYCGSIFDDFAVKESAPKSIQKVVVTLGTHETYGFKRAVNRLKNILPKDAEVLWQTGSTDVSDLDIDGHKSVPAPELTTAIEEADIVVSHAGTGSALTCFSMGKVPVFVPRRPELDEHVDDHQLVLTNELKKRNLVVAAEADELTLDDLERGASLEVVSAGRPKPFRLED